MMEWLQGFFGGFWQWMSDRFYELLDALNPVNIAMSAITYFISFLPDPDPRIPVLINNLLVAMIYAMEYLRLLDYFINFGFFVFCLGIIFAFEAVFLPVRVWRIIRSFVT